MAALRRLKMDLQNLKKSSKFNYIEIDENDIFNWEILLLPENPPYNKGAFRITINFPSEYPFKPPCVTFVTKIYHPNINEKGFTCHCFKQNWKPSTTVEQVIQTQLDLIDKPELDHALRINLMREFEEDKGKFMMNAEQFTKKYAEKRPE